MMNALIKKVLNFACGNTSGNFENGHVLKKSGLFRKNALILGAKLLYYRCKYLTPAEK